MKKEHSSSTADSVAASRAQDSLRPPGERTIDDPYAAMFAGRINRALLGLGRVKWIRDFVTAHYDRKFPGVMGEAVFRTAKIDAILSQAIRDTGAPLQIVILGAGFDSRSLRLVEPSRGAHCRWFEVDHPATQKRKQQILASSRLDSPSRFVAVDFQSSSLNQLLSAGFDPKTPSIFVMEGVSYYLTESAFEETLSWIRKHSPSSRLVFNFLVKSFMENPDSFFGGRRIMDHVVAVGEPFLLGFHPEHLADWLRKRGFELASEESVEAYARPLLGARKSVYYFSELFRIAQARAV